MWAVASMDSAAGRSDRRPPQLENEECLHSRKFLRCYEGRSQVAELVAGNVYLSSPLRVRQAKPQGGILAQFDPDAGRHPESETLANLTVIFAATNVMRPTAPLCHQPKPAILSRVNPNESRRQLLAARNVLPQPRLPRPPLAAVPRWVGAKSPSRRRCRQAPAADGSLAINFQFHPLRRGGGYVPQCVQSTSVTNLLII